MIRLLKKKGQTITEDFFNKPPLDNICWLNFKVKNNEKAKKLYFRVGRADIHHFEAFKVTPQKIDTLILSGDSKPFIQRPIQVADLSFPIELKPYERASIVIEKRGEELNMNFFLKEEQKFYGSVQKDYNFIFFYLGILFIIFLFNFFLWINLKDTVHLIYIGIVISNTIFILSLSGLGFQYIWSNFVNKNSLIGVFTTSLHFSLIIFFARVQ